MSLLLTTHELQINNRKSQKDIQITEKRKRPHFKVRALFKPDNQVIIISIGIFQDLFNSTC